MDADFSQIKLHIYNNYLVALQLWPKLASGITNFENSSRSDRSYYTDQEPPSVVCPSTTVSHSRDMHTNVVVTWPELKVTDNSYLPTTSYCNNSSGSSFAPGSTIVICYATDQAGNIESCQFEVFVEGKPCCRLGIYNYKNDQANKVRTPKI